MKCASHKRINMILFYLSSYNILYLLVQWDIFGKAALFKFPAMFFMTGCHINMNSSMHRFRCYAQLGNNGMFLGRRRKTFPHAEYWCLRFIGKNAFSMPLVEDIIANQLFKPPLCENIKVLVLAKHF